MKFAELSIGSFVLIEASSRGCIGGSTGAGRRWPVQALGASAAESGRNAEPKAQKVNSEQEKRQAQPTPGNAQLSRASPNQGGPPH